MNAPTLDLDARYSVDGWSGIAVYIAGYSTREVEIETAEDVDGETLYSYECETVEDRSFVYVVMVGDDRRHLVDVDDLTILDDLDYCAECGQIGCPHDGRDRETS